MAKEKTKEKPPRSSLNLRQGKTTLDSLWREEEFFRGCLASPSFFLFFFGTDSNPFSVLWFCFPSFLSNLSLFSFLLLIFSLSSKKKNKKRFGSVRFIPAVPFFLQKKPHEDSFLIFSDSSSFFAHSQTFLFAEKKHEGVLPILCGRGVFFSWLPFFSWLWDFSLSGRSESAPRPHSLHSRFSFWWHYYHSPSFPVLTPIVYH